MTMMQRKLKLFQAKKTAYYASLVTAAALLLTAGCSSAPTSSSSAPSGAASQPPASYSEAGLGALPATLTEDGSLLIDKASLSGEPTFYAYEADGTPLELIAAVASDDSVRLAFNTCQVCYDSGRGYYLFENGSLVCQNCGNRFGIDQMGTQRGGCNPIPVSEQAVTEDETSITVSVDYLKEAAVVFENWKR